MDSFVAAYRDTNFETRALATDQALNVRYRPGDIVPWHFTPAIIVASFFASLTGTLLTVELLHRKRLGKSIISRFVLGYARLPRT